MRELPVLTPDCEVDKHAVGILQASMMHPDDLESIRDDADVYRMQVSKEFPNTALWRRMNADWRAAATTGGLRAGIIIYKMAVFRNRPDLGKVGHNKAIHMVVSEGRETGSPVEKKAATFKGDWVQYRNAAHLWAALTISYDESGKVFPVDVVRWLQIADDLRRIVAPVIENWDPWCAPLSFPKSGVAYNPGPPDEEDIRLLKQYRSRDVS